jgi:hypothetical protein
MSEDQTNRSRVAIEQIAQQPQRQDSLNDQLIDLHRVAVKLGCYDAADWIARWRFSVP